MTPLEKAARACVEVLGQPWEETIQEERDLAFGFARAVLMAVREPRIDVGLVGAEQVNIQMRGPTKADYCAAQDAFTAMIDHILTGEE